MSIKPTCRACNGTGKLLLLRSWFTSDGFRSCKCYMCGGTGHTSDSSPDLNAAQARFRETVKHARAA